MCLLRSLTIVRYISNTRYDVRPITIPATKTVFDRQFLGEGGTEYRDAIHPRSQPVIASKTTALSVGLCLCLTK